MDEYKMKLAAAAAKAAQTRLAKKPGRSNVAEFERMSEEDQPAAARLPDDVSAEDFLNARFPVMGNEKRCELVKKAGRGLPQRARRTPTLEAMTTAFDVFEHSRVRERP